MTALIRAYAGTVVVAGLIAGAWGAVFWGIGRDCCPHGEAGGEL